MDQGLGLLPLGASGEPGPHCLGGGRWQGPLPLFLSGFEAWLWVVARMLAEGQLWTLDQWENGSQWLDSLAVFDLIKPPPLFGEKDLRYCHARVLATPQHLFPEPPLFYLAYLARISRGGVVGAQSMEGAIIYLFAHDARNSCQPPSHRVRCPPECQANSEGPNAAGLQPGAPPT